MLDPHAVARALGGEVARGQVRAPGPGHSGKDRSLCVKLDPAAPDGFIVWSFSGDGAVECRDYVRDKLGLPAFKANGHGSYSPDRIEAGLLAAIMGQSSGSTTGRIVAVYDYADHDGTLLYQVLRYEPKDFRQRRPDGNGGWIWKLDERRVVYRLGDLLKYPDATAFVTEGEKDADRVASLGLCATTVTSGTWTAECVQALAGRDVVILEDNDDAGRDRARKAATVLHGVAKTIRVVSFRDLPDKGDVSDWLDADTGRDADALIEKCFAAPLWTSEAATADTTTESKAPDDAQPLPFINIIGWQDGPVPERAWIVKDRIPERAVTLLSGEGSVGKSILALHLGVAVVLSRDWLNAMPADGPALIVCAEDDEAELHRRLDKIRAHFGVGYGDLKRLHLLSLVGRETLMAVPDRSGVIQPTKLFTQLCEAACDIRPKLVVLDNAADIYGGSENDRAQVRRFIAMLAGLALTADCGVLLTSHPSLTGISSGSGLSGSTAWNASVRSRLYFKRATTERDEEPDPDLRQLETVKSNYARTGECLTLRWTDGLFLPVAGVSDLERLAAWQRLDQLFLDLLDRLQAQGRSVSDRPKANNYAPTVFAATAEAKDQHLRKGDFAAAMERLYAAGKVRSETYGPPSRGWTKLVRQ
jgi:RecA-family ATPase